VTSRGAAIPSDQLLDALEVAVVVFDRDGKVLIANRRARDDLAILGDPLGGESGLFEHDFELLDEHGRRLAATDLPSVRTLRTGEVLESFVMGVRSRLESDTIWITVATKPLTDDHGDISAVICSFFDITAQRRAEERLRASEERFRAMAETAGDVLYRFTVGPTPRIDYVNPAVEAVLGYAPEEFYEDPGLIVKVTYEDDIPRVRALGTDGVDRGELSQIRMVRRDGTVIWTEHRMMPLRNPDGVITGVAGIARDVTALKVKEAYLSHQALHDPLTGLPNRVLLLDRLEAALARLQRHDAHLAVLYLDLDRFKTVNDNLGHDAGDRLLQAVGHRLQETVRPSDSVARLGGDEFAAVLSDLHDPSEAMLVSERLLAAVAEPVDLGEGPVVTTVSIGVASTQSGEHQLSAGELLRRADFAMYAAKDRGRSRIETYSAHDPGGARDS
jgi:diguanylate cyclase (GGDEF)-like protein/PAS domain S-box-containing protein